MQRRGRLLKHQQRPAHAQRPAFRLPHRQGFGQHFAAEQRQRQQREQRQRRQRPLRVEGHPQRDGEHGGVGERVAQRQRRQQILRMVEQGRDHFARARIFFRELRHLPFAEGKQRRFRQREKETRARENQNRRHGLLHARMLSAKPRMEKVNSVGINLFPSSGLLFIFDKRQEFYIIFTNL